MSILKNKINKNSELKSDVKKYTFFDKELSSLIKKSEYEFYDNYILFLNNCCPSCACVMDNQITRTIFCPNCKEKIIVRTNKLNRKKLLLNEKQIRQYDIFEKRIKEIHFCEKYISAINSMYPDYMDKFYSLKLENPKLSVRDYAFLFENWLYVKLDCEAYREYTEGLKLNFKDKVLKCDRAIWKLKGSNNIFRYMIELTKFEGKDDATLEMIFNLLYRNVNIAYLPYYHYENRPYNEAQFYADIYDVSMTFLYKYIEKHNLDIEKLKSAFMNSSVSFVMDIIDKEKAWILIVDAYYKYLELLKDKDSNIYIK